MRDGCIRGTPPKGGRRSAAALAALLAVLLLAAAPSPASAGPRIRLSPSVGPPTTLTAGQGTGFGLSEVVDLTFDDQPWGTATTDGQGRFAAPIRVPAQALPGPHAVQATGESSGLSARAPFLIQTDWPQFHFTPQHTGLNPYENVLSPETVGGLQVAWTFTATDGFLGSPVVGEGRVFAGAGDTMYGLDAATGALLWKHRERLADMADGAVWNGVVYYPTSLGDVHAVRGATGKPLWTWAAGSGIFGGLTLSQGVIYVGAVNGRTYALDARTGHELWRADTLSSVFPAPAVAGGVVYVATTGSFKLYALDAATGAMVWTGDMGYESESTPAVGDGMVYVGSDDDTLYAFDASGCGQAQCSRCGPPPLVARWSPPRRWRTDRSSSAPTTTPSTPSTQTRGPWIGSSRREGQFNLELRWWPTGWCTAAPPTATSMPWTPRPGRSCGTTPLGMR